MKIRLGFVGNSSSSSFIIGLGVIDKITEIIKHVVRSSPWLSLHKLDWDSDEGNLIVENRPKELAVGMGPRYAQLFHESFTGEMIGLPVQKSDKYILVVDYIGNEGDDFFALEDASFDYALIDEDFFLGDEVPSRLIKILKGEDQEIPCKRSDMLIGAGRNG